MSYTLRINPVAPYDGPGMERWLETCAAQGLFPGRIGDGFCWLRKGEPKARRYRLAAGTRTWRSGRPSTTRQAGTTPGPGAFSTFSSRRTRRPRSPTPTERAALPPWTAWTGR